jgi:acetolactate synthase-1/2/3 large subunit
VKGDDTIVVNELGVPAAFLQFSQLRTFIGNPPAGGLGFALGAGLGAKLAAPERDVIVAVGDGSYMFGNPLPYHFVSNAEKLPTLTVISNNSMWGAVREATLDVYPNGSAKQANVTPLVSLNPSPSFEAVIGACGGYGKLIDSADELLPALKDGMSRVRAGQSVLLNVITRPRRS